VKRVHLVVLSIVLLIVLLVLALFALRSNHRPTSHQTGPSAIQKEFPTAPDAPPGGSAGREDPGIGTSSLPRAPASLERP